MDEMFMNPLLDNLLVFATVTAAVGWFVWHAWRRKGQGGGGCGPGCGGCADDPPQPPGRRGEQKGDLTAKYVNHANEDGKYFTTKSAEITKRAGF
jgi:hypothetical protein